MKINDGNGIIPPELPGLNLPPIDKIRKSDNDFMSDLIRVTNEVNKAIIIASVIVPRKNIKLEKLNVIRGNLVRLYKLYDSYIFLIVECRTEIACIILRALAETIINLKYLLKHNLTDVYKKYKRASLAYEDSLRKVILENTSNRACSLPIEERMLKSIKNSFLRSEIDNIEKKELEKTKWGLEKGHLEISGKAKDVELELFYRTVFKSSSHFIHGSWHELDFHHLKKPDKRGDRQLQWEYAIPSPNLIEGISVHVLDVLSEYLSIAMEDMENSATLKVRLKDISDWFIKMAEHHEGFILQEKLKKHN